MKVVTLRVLGVSGLMVSGLMMTGELARSYADTARVAQNACASATTQQALNQCATQAQQQADQSLKDFVAEYQTRLSSEQVIMLQHTQASWRLFRRFSCEFEASGVAGGSAYPMVFSGCMAAKATARLSELQKMAQCEEGDLSCPARETPRH